MFKLADVINVSSIVPVFLTGGYAAIHYRNLHSILKKFTWYLLFAGVIQLASAILWFRKENNMPLLHLYVAGGFFLLARVYIAIWRRYINPSIIVSITVLFLAFTIINSLFVQDLYSYNAYARTAESVLMIVFSLSSFVLFINVMTEESAGPPWKSLRWINSGILIYYTASLIIFFSGNVLETLSPIRKYIWVIHSGFSVVMYGCFFVGLCTRDKS